MPNLATAQNAVATWHKFPNPGGTISTKKCPISNPEGKILTKNVLFTTQGAEFWSNMSYLQPRDTILTKNVILPTPRWFKPNSS